MTVRNPDTKDATLLPTLRRVRWTWRRWVVLGLAVLPLIDQFFVPVSLWDLRRGEGVLFLVLIFRAMAPAQPPMAVLVACACLVAVSGAMGHGIVREVSPVWMPIALVLLLFLLFSWRWGRK